MVKQLDTHRDDGRPSEHYALKLIKSQFCMQKPPAEDCALRATSRWSSSSSSECEIDEYESDSESESHDDGESIAPNFFSEDKLGATARALNSTKQRGRQCEPGEDFPETSEEKLQRYRRFFQGVPLMRCLKECEDEYQGLQDTLLFDKLYNEVQYGLADTWPSKYRTQEFVRAYWDDVREQLNIDDSELYDPQQGPMSEDEEIPSDNNIGLITKSPGYPSGWEKPARLDPSSGKDLALQEVRDLFTEKRKYLAHAATY